jgi:hypothetical protein
MQYGLKDLIFFQERQRYKMSMEQPFVFSNYDDIFVVGLCINCIFKLEKILADDYPHMMGLNLELTKVCVSCPVSCVCATCIT